MSIDWFTFVAQIINFLILVGLLRWFLYAPIMDAMQKREDKIASRWREAEQRTTEADEKARQYDQRGDELEKQREELLKTALHEANQYRERLSKEARDEVENKRTEWLRSLAHERTEILDKVRQQVGEMAIDTARQTLAELATADLEDSMVNNFVDRLRHLDDQQRDEIKMHLSNGESDFRVQSTFTLSDQWRASICAIIHESFGEHGEVAFTESDELICGIEFVAGGYSFGWNVDQYVRQIDSEFRSIPPTHR